MNFKAQSEVLGVILLLSISITAIGGILLFGQPILTGAEEDVQFDRMENEFSLLDASVSSSVLGASDSGSFSVNVEGGSLVSNPNASWMRVTYNDPSDPPEELANITIGNLQYTQNRKTLAYEGGAVWRSNEGENFSSMVSSPEFHYRGSTLTLPAYNIENKIAVSGSRNSIRVDSANDPNLVFPDQDLDNPLEEGNVTVTVKSEYYKGWESFFRDRTTGAIQEVKEDEQKVIFSLEVPKELLLTSGVMYTQGGSVTEKSNPTVESSEPIDIDLPSTETIVGPEFDKCFPNPGLKPDCVDLTGVSGGSDLDESKTYYVKSSDTPYTMGEFDAPSANVTILVDGELEYKNDFDVGTTSADPVEVYTDGDLYFGGGGDINTGSDTGNSSMFITYVNEPYGVYRAGGGTVDYTGIIYAPGTNHNGGSCSGSDKLNGDLNIKGSLIVTSACVAGNAELTYYEDLDLLDLTPDDVSLVRYLHITENDIELSS